MRILCEDILDDLDVRSANSVEKSLDAASEINPDLYDCAFVIEIGDNSQFMKKANVDKFIYLMQNICDEFCVTEMSWEEINSNDCPFELKMTPIATKSHAFVVQAKKRIRLAEFMIKFGAYLGKYIPNEWGTMWFYRPDEYGEYSADYNGWNRCVTPDLWISRSVDVFYKNVDDKYLISILAKKIAVLWCGELTEQELNSQIPEDKYTEHYVDYHETEDAVERQAYALCQKRKAKTWVG